MDPATILLTVIVVALLVERYFDRKSAREERAALATQNALERDSFIADLNQIVAYAATERRELLEQATDERRELLTRVQHPQLLVTKAESPSTAAAVAPEPDDEWPLVGVVQPTVESDVELEPEPAEAVP